MKGKLALLAAAALIGASGAGFGQAPASSQSSSPQPWSITTPWQGSGGSGWGLNIDGNAFDGAGVQPTGGVSLVSTDNLNLDMFGRLQMLGVGENVADPVRNNNRLYLFTQESRLGFRGNFEGYKYETQLSLGGEEVVTSNVALTLLDMDFDVPVPVGPDTSVKVGQFRVPYGREAMTDTGYMPFTDRSILSTGFSMGRDYGLALQGYDGKFAGTAGIFSGGGEDVPQRYLGEALGIPVLAVRVGYNDGVDADIYHVVQTDLNITKPEKAAYVSGVFAKDTTIGHSTALNLKDTGKNLLIDSNWNPYIANGSPIPNNTMGDGDLYMVEGDAVYRVPLGNGKAWTAQAEVDWGGYQNQYGRVHEAGAEAQVGYLFKPFEVDMRYAVLLPDENMGYFATYNAGTKTTTQTLPGQGGSANNFIGGRAIHEIDPSATWYLKGQNVKLVLDAPIYLNMPVTVDSSVGSYVLADMPDQITTYSGGMKRETVAEIRGMLQFMF